MRAIFALLFLLIRVVIWIGFALFYWRDYFTVMRLVDVPTWDVGRASLIVGMNVILTVLQLIWGRLVLMGVLKVLGCGKDRTPKPKSS